LGLVFLRGCGNAYGDFYEMMKLIKCRLSWCVAGDVMHCIALLACLIKKTRTTKETEKYVINKCAHARDEQEERRKDKKTND